MNTDLLPLVSVCMVSYNSSRYIEEAITSILNQSYQNFELVICDDNSTDNTFEIVERFADKRIVKIRNPKNLGEYPNRNSVIDVANGEYLIFIDADDVMYSHGLEFMMRFAMQFPDCGMIISRPWDERILFPKRISPHDFYSFEYLDRGIMGINFTKVLFRKEALLVNRFPAKVRLGDVYIQLKVAQTWNSLIIPDASTWWRRTVGQASERLLKDYFFYLEHDLWIKLDMLSDKANPLTETEREIAYHNIFGNYLRFLFKQCLRLRIPRVLRLYRMYPTPWKYFPSVLKSQQRNYFARFSGINPMREAINA